MKGLLICAKPSAGIPFCASVASFVLGVVLLCRFLGVVETPGFLFGGAGEEREALACALGCLSVSLVLLLAGSINARFVTTYRLEYPPEEEHTQWDGAAFKGEGLIKRVEQVRQDYARVVHTAPGASATRQDLLSRASAKIVGKAYFRRPPDENTDSKEP
jgi:hypothetical protein